MTTVEAGSWGGRRRNEEVAELLARFDATFRADDGAEMARFFTGDACLQWPEMDDVVGNDAIRDAFTALTLTFRRYRKSAIGSAGPTPWPMGQAG